MKKFKSIIALLLLVILVLGTAGCGTKLAETNAGPKILRIALTDYKMKLDVHVTPYGINEIINNILDTLVELTPAGEVKPLLLKELPRVSSDGLVYSFELKPGIKFQNGDILKSSDVKFTLERALSPATKATTAQVYMPIKGSMEMMTAKAAELSGFKVVDDTKFEITLNEAFGGFLLSLTDDEASIYPEKACKAAGTEWGVTKLVGTGPYSLKSFDQATREIVLDKFNDYFGGAKKLDQIQIKLFALPATAGLEFEKGNIDMVEVTGDSIYMKDPKYKDLMVTSYVKGYGGITFNYNFPTLKDVKVRQAISYAIDRQKLADASSGQAIAATGCLSPGMLGYDKSTPPYEYNPEKAKQLLAEAGYKDGLEIEFWAMSNRDNLIIQSMLKEVGINVKIAMPGDQAAMIEKLKAGQMQMVTGFCQGLDSADMFFRLFFSANTLMSGSSYKSNEVDSLILQSRKTSDEKERVEIYKKLNTIISKQDLPVLPLISTKVIVMVRPTVKNVDPVRDGGEMRAYNYDIK